MSKSTTIGKPMSRVEDEAQVAAHLKHGKKITVVGLLWGAQLFSYAIRYALGVVAPILMKLYHISPKTMGYILSGWNWTYTGSQLFVGPLVDRFGCWLTMAVGSAVWGLTTIALPIASAAASLFLMRVLFGIGQSVLIPCTATSVSEWFGTKDRSRAIAVAYSGNQVGLAIGATVAAFVLAELGWRAVFYCIGGSSLVMTLAWIIFYPRSQPAVKPPQKQDLDKHSATHPQAWADLFHYRSTWGIALGQMGYLYAFYFFVSWLPGYLILERKMTILKTGLVSALPFVAGLLATLGGGWLADNLTRRGVSLTVSRKGIIGPGLLGATVMVILAAFTASDWLAVTFLTACMACLRLTTGSVNSLPIDLAPPSLVGSLASIQNFAANIGGLLAPIATGYIVAVTGSFVGALVMAGGMALFGAISYVFLMGRVEAGLTG